MIALTSWLIIGLAIVSLWALWGMLNLDRDMMERWYDIASLAGRIRRTCQQQGEGRSSSWQQQSS